MVIAKALFQLVHLVQLLKVILAQQLMPKANKKTPKTKRGTPAARWCFTWNNYPDDWKTVIESAIATAKVKYPKISWIGGLEVAPTTGTRHVQGYMEFAPAGSTLRVRPMEALSLPKEVHWGDDHGKPCRGSRSQNVEYCTKTATEVSGTLPYDPVLTLPTIYGWQLEALKIATAPPDSRTIHWYWEANGGMGKSTFVRYLCVLAKTLTTLRPLVVGGKAADMKHGIVSMKERTGLYPTLILLDVPRTSMDYLSYTGIEEVKNGVFFSQKYESAMVVMPYPVIMVFANEEPCYGKMSQDRWCVQKIGGV